MAKLIWLGEPEGDSEGPLRNTWNGYTFKKGEAVEVDNEQMIAKARRNPFYSVDGKVYDPKAPDADGKPTVRKDEGKKKAGPVIANEAELNDMNVAELREQAEARGLDHDGLNKTELREKLINTPVS